MNVQFPTLGNLPSVQVQAKLKRYVAAAPSPIVALFVTGFK